MFKSVPLLICIMVCSLSLVANVLANGADPPNVLLIDVAKECVCATLGWMICAMPPLTSSMISQSLSLGRHDLI